MRRELMKKQNIQRFSQIYEEKREDKIEQFRKERQEDKQSR